jgi:hypothetical protein
LLSAFISDLAAGEEAVPKSQSIVGTRELRPAPPVVSDKSQLASRTGINISNLPNVWGRCCYRKVKEF